MRTLMDAFFRFNKGLMKMPTHVHVWLVLLVGANAILPLFFLDRAEARVVVLTFVASAMLMTVLTAVAGFGRLLGLGHLLWIPLLYYLWPRLGQIPANDVFGLWIRVLMLLNAISLAIDVTDVIRFFAGDREEIVKGL